MRMTYRILPRMKIKKKKPIINKEALEDDLNATVESGIERTTTITLLD